MTQLIVTGRIRTDPALVGELLADLRAGIPRSLEEDGCRFYCFALEDAAAGTLLTLQIWRDEAALAAHLSTAEIGDLIAKWGARFEVQTRLYDALNERAVGHWSDPELERRVNASRVNASRVR